MSYHVIHACGTRHSCSFSGRGRWETDGDDILDITVDISHEDMARKMGSDNMVKDGDAAAGMVSRPSTDKGRPPKRS